jgi:SNF2 family DNA or RNA helicase
VHYIFEQGTGKTRTTLEFIKYRINNHKINKVLWLCPCSCKKNLRDDIVKHVDYVPDFLIIAGIESLSSSVGLASTLLDLSKTNDCFLIVDESNLVKNHKAIRSRRIELIAQNCKYRMILNGTPISRTEADLFWQWYILDYRILGYQSYWSFARNHLEFDDAGRIRRVLEIDYLTKKIEPYSYQVKKSECINLDSKRYDTVYFDMTDVQRNHYYEIADEYLFHLDEMKPSTIYRLFTVLQHVVAGRWIISKYKDNIKTKPMFTINNNLRYLSFLNIITNNKTIIWCKYTQEIKDIKQLLGDSAVTFYGEMSLKKRNQAIEEFRTDKTYLIANKTCAGYGLNLQFCNRAIYYSNDWDYATRSQSEDRIHRIGQDRECFFTDICCNGTIDERILNCLFRKERLLDSFKSSLKSQLKKELNLHVDNQI